MNGQNEHKLATECEQRCVPIPLWGLWPKALQPEKVMSNGFSVHSTIISQNSPCIRHIVGIIAYEVLEDMAPDFSEGVPNNFLIQLSSLERCICWFHIYWMVNRHFLIQNAYLYYWKLEKYRQEEKWKRKSLITSLPKDLTLFASVFILSIFI